MNILFLDLETTGVDENKHSIIEIAAKFYVNGQLRDTFESKTATYNQEVDLGALGVNNFTIKEILSHPPSPEVAYALAEFLVNVKKNKGKGPIYLCGHNVAFDEKFLDRFLAIHSITGLHSVLGHKKLDTATLAIALIDAGVLNPEKTSLEYLAKELGISLEGRNLHKAMDDVDLTIEVYYKMLDLLRKING